MESLASHLERFGAARVLVVGDVMLDHYVYGTAERLSPEAPIPVMSVERERYAPGGAANVAFNVAALGGSAVLIGLIGEDPAARTLCDLVGRQAAIDARLLVEPQRTTTQKTRFVIDRQQVLRADRESGSAASAAAAAGLIEAFASAVRAADVVVLSDYAKGVLSDGVLPELIALARQHRKPVVADPKSRTFARYAGAAVLTPNRREICIATGLPCDSDDEAAAAAEAVLAHCGVDAVLVTRGAQGMTLVSGDAAPLHLPTVAHEVFDVTGAGDTALATLAVALAAGAPLAEAAQLANAAAGVVVAKVGTATASHAELATALQTQALTRSEAKIVTLETALERVAAWRARGERIGFTNGCFDLIHPGHIGLLDRARAACNRLIVGLNTDASVARLKGPGRPVQGETARAIVLASLGAVDLVVPFDSDTPSDLIHAIRPDLLVKGADYRIDQVVGAEFVQSYGGRVLLVDLLPGHSTTATISRLEAAAPPHKARA